ncbi:hypothetical protein ACFSRY_17520 [Pontibacter locisalis]|uniref:Uncharacterized protein n=1 Tax=Pontibacter locisalis TaxID=1719035 RepID=A0ABW5IRG5_9BACT
MLTFRKSIRVTAAALSFVLLLASCEKDASLDVEPNSDPVKSIDGGLSVSQDARKGGQTTSYTTYLIKKGQHSSSNSGFKSLSTSSLKFEALFDRSAIYQTVDPVNQADINKLYGMSDCGSHHQTNSARFGWRWFNNALEIHAYVYRNGIRASELIGTVSIDKAYQYELILDGTNYIFKVAGVGEAILARGCNGKGSGYQLYPYFGGDEVAPHDITIKIRNL